ncbi:hypothetical protein [Cupriavidus sp. RAF12]|uniref:hypothetical protein n=1 Tax=Cupriavidus sp. RAF12 TaxID=3233050 RepID=UPI003F921F72
MPVFARQRHLACLLAAAAMLCAALTPADAQGLANAPTQGEMAGSVVSRLVAWRARTDQPVTLSALTAFDWDSFSVVRAPAGEALANCNREGFLPCDPALQPPPNTLIQVLRFDRAGRPVYQERIIVASGYFADPLPAAVPRDRATLVSCQDAQGEPLWCVQGRHVKPAQRYLDGG